MSKIEEIRAVYESDIREKDRVVWSKQDAHVHFFDGFDGMRIEYLYTPEEREMLYKLSKICANQDIEVGGLPRNRGRDKGGKGTKFERSCKPE